MSDIITDLRNIRIETKMSQQELANNLGMNSQSGISALERGIRSPLLSTLTCWAEILGYEIVLRPKS